MCWTSAFLHESPDSPSQLRGFGSVTRRGDFYLNTKMTISTATLLVPDYRDGPVPNH